MKKTGRLLALILVLALIVCMLSACGSSDETAAQTEETVATEATASETENETEDSQTVEASEEPEAASEEQAEDEIEATDVQEESTDKAALYWLSDEMVTLTYWLPIQDEIKSYFNEMTDLPVYQEAESLLNVKIDAISYSNDAVTEQFNLMVVSGEYPDLVRDALSSYSGGGAQALEDDFVIDLTDLLEEYGQDYLDYIQNDETVYQSCLTNGMLLAVFSVAEEAIVNQGFVIRQDWLDELGLEVPTTIDEWDTVLHAFQDAYDITDPLQMPSNLYSFASAYGVADYMAMESNPMNYATWLYTDEGTVKGAFLEDGYQDYLRQVNEWYNEGIINADFFSRPQSENDNTNVQIYQSGNAGIFYCWNLSQMDTADFAEDGVVLTALPYPVLNEGEINNFGCKRELVKSTSVSVTSACDNPELAVQWLNFWFTETGAELSNYGIEGLSWERTDDGWTYTDLVLNNPDGMSVMEARSYYGLAGTPHATDPTIETIDYEDWDWECVEVWESTSTASSRLLSAYALNTEESEIYNTYVTDLETYAQTSVLQFAIGVLDIETQWDEFVETCISLGAEECIAAYQGAVDRFWNGD